MISLLRGNEFADLNDHASAITDFDLALRLNRRSYAALAGRASSKMSLGRLAEARQYLKKSLALDPPDEDRRQIEEFLQYLEGP